MFSLFKKKMRFSFYLSTINISYLKFHFSVNRNNMIQTADHLITEVLSPTIVSVGQVDEDVVSNKQKRIYGKNSTKK